MKRIGLMGTVLAAMVFSTMALGFEVYFADSAGNKLGKVWEGQYVYIVIEDPDKGACGIDQFQADLVIFDWKTGAWWGGYNLWFRELGGIGSGKYFLVRDQGSSSKVGFQIGSRFIFGGAGPIEAGMIAYTHWTGLISPMPAIPGSGVQPTIHVGPFWAEGDWEYLDFNVFTGGLPQDKLVARFDLGAYFGFLEEEELDDPGVIFDVPNAGRFENNDTVIVIARDTADIRNYAQAQLKIIDTVSTITVTPNPVEYGCAPSCQNIIVRIEDKDEDLNCNEIEYVPFFVIVNPGSWNPVQTYQATNFCSLIRWGGTTSEGEPWADNDVAPGEDGHTVMAPIRWYNIYAPNAYDDGVPPKDQVGRYISYAGAPWWNPDWPDISGGAQVMLAQFFAAETGVGTGVFELNLGNLEDFQEMLFQSPDGRKVRFPMGTTIAFYYVDPNDFDDMDLTTITVGSRPHGAVFFTSPNGVQLPPGAQVKIGHDGLYIRVHDADANDNACCQDTVVVHICDPHFEDDSEYIVIDEVSNNSGVFATQSGIRLEPVWDAVNGYQLVFDDWNVQAFNEDTIFVRYNSLEYVQESLNQLGDGDPNSEITVDETELGFDVDGDGELGASVYVRNFPPLIDYTAGRNQYWDVSFAKVKVYDFQVFDGTTHCMKFLDGEYKPVTEIGVAGNLYLEVCDYDQNEDPRLRELIRGDWNKDAQADEPWVGWGTLAMLNDWQDPAFIDEDSMPLWGATYYLEGGSQTPASSISLLANGFVPDWVDGYGLFNQPDPRAPRSGLPFLADQSISGKRPTVKIFMFNAQRGTWERIDLHETGVNTGIFRSTTCVAVGEDGLGSSGGDTIMAFYQDPSNHSDIAIISIKVSEGGAGGITPPVVALSVAFDRTTYYPGDTVTITVTDEQYAGAAEIVGTNVLVLLDKDGTPITSWNKLDEVAGQPGKFRVTYVLPETVKLGTITAKYTDPMISTRVAQAQATVVAKALQNVTGIAVSPNPFKTSTTFTIQAEPTGAVAQKITITVYDLTGAKVDTIEGANTASVTWTGGNLRNGAYIYVAVVEGAGKVFGPFKGFVYIER